MLVFAQGENLDFIFQCCPQKKMAKNTGICFEINRTRMEAIYVKTVSSHTGVKLLFKRDDVFKLVLW